MVEEGAQRWGLSPATRVELINLSENATFRLCDAASGRDLALRVHRLGYSSAAEIRCELAWIEALRREAVIETARPCAGSDGDFVQQLASPAGGPSRHAVAFEFLPGHAPDDPADMPRWFERLGELTARLHQHARGWGRPPAFRRKRWDLDGMVGVNAYWGPWRAAIGLDAGGAALLERALAHIERRLAQFGTGVERFGLVHADLRLANLLVDGERLRVLDFDDCGFSWFLYDFAAAVSFMEHEAAVVALLTAWLEGYSRVAPLPAAERREIPTFVALRRILLTAWLASHRELPLAQARAAPFTAGTLCVAESFLSGRFLS